MLQLFRSFQAAGIFILLGFAVLIRAVAFVMEIPNVQEAVLNPWGSWLDTFWQGGGVLDWGLGAACVTLLGFGSSYSLNHYRLSAAGLLPGYVTILLGSATWWWLGFSPLLIGAIFTAYAAHRLFECYRYQGIALPVFDSGILIGGAFLIAPGFGWFLPAAVVGLAQLRGFRFTDFFGILIGAVLPAFLIGIFRFLKGTLDSYLWIDGTDMLKLTESLFTMPSIDSLTTNWPWLSVVAMTSLVAVVGLGKLTTRRPIQEQRYNRLIYNFLAAGWLALLFSGTPTAWSLAYVLFPLGLLLGIWLSELSRKRASTSSTIALILVLAGFLWTAIN